MSSKPGAVGKDMPGALKGDQDHRLPISSSWGGNSIPGHSHHPDNSQSVSEWTKNHLKERREQAKK